MRRLFTTYRVLAIVVGILLAFGSFVAIPLRYLTTEGSDLQELGETLSVVWVLHGWLYMVYLVVAFLFARRSRWSMPFTLLMLVAGRGSDPDLLGRAPRGAAHARRAPGARQRLGSPRDQGRGEDRVRAGWWWRSRSGRGGHAASPVRTRHHPRPGARHQRRCAQRGDGRPGSEPRGHRTAGRVVDDRRPGARGLPDAAVEERTTSRLLRHPRLLRPAVARPAPGGVR